MPVGCTLLVNLWNAGGPQPRLLAEVSAQDVEFASVPASGDRIRAGSLGVVMESFHGLAVVDRVEQAPRLPFDLAPQRARTVVVVNIALTRDVTGAEFDRLVDVGWTVIAQPL